MILKAEGINRQFIRETENTNIFYAVKKTDFRLEPGVMTVLEGHSGSGKTTFLNMLAGLLRPSEGRVVLDDTDIYNMNDKELSMFRNKYFGIIPQGQTAVSTLTVLENVMLPATIYKNSINAEKKAEELLERMGMIHLKNVFPKELSGGELRRVSIARALILDPGVIFADEPTSDLDDRNTDLVFNILKQISREGKAVIVVTHERNAERYADRMLRMTDGCLEEANASEKNRN